MSLFTPIAYRRIKPTAAGPTYPTNGLVLCLDNTAASYPGTGTTWYDTSGNGYDFTTVGSPSWTEADGWDLNGSNQYLTGSSAATTGLNGIFTNTKAARNGLSIFARILVDVTPSDAVIFAGWTASITKILFEVNSNDSFEVAINTATTGVTGGNTTGTMSLNTKSIVGFNIESNGVVNVYNNNTLINGSPATIPNENFANTTPWYRIGAREFPAGTVYGPMNGKIKGLMIYNRALDATDRTSVYNYLNGL